MSAESVYCLSDENPDLQKQIGCMNGLFQLFDRHHFLGSRRVDSPNNKRLSLGQNGEPGTKPNSASDKENNLKKTVKEKQRFTFESPRTSLSSSSCSSSFSFADCSKASQVDRSSSSQTTFPETTRQEELANYQSNASLQSSQHSLDLRNVVNDSIYREANGLSTKTTTKVDAGRHQTFTYIDSPRPLRSPKSTKTRNINLNESSRVLPRLQEAPRTSNERKDSSFTFAPRDAPRFSSDGRGLEDALKIKLKDLPRLSLDSRESSMKGSKSNFLLGELQRSSINSNDIRNQRQEPGSYKGQSSVLAKLIGLEPLPDPMPTNGNQSRQINTCQDLKDDPLSQSSRIDENRNWISGSPRNFKKEPSSPCLTNTGLKKPAATKCPIETAPWKQDGIRDQTSTSKCRETPMKGPNSSLTVYGEIQKRLAELEFKKSGKDLRALKQILKAMQKPKPMLEIRKEDQASNFLSSPSSILDQSSEAPKLRKPYFSNAVSATVKGTSSPTLLKSPITIPAKFMENASNCTSSVVATGSLSKLRTSSSADNRNGKVDNRSYKDLTPRPNHPKDLSSRLHSKDKSKARTLLFNHTLKRPSTTARENHKLAMSSETTCLNQKKNKLELEKQSHCTSRALDRGKSRRQSSRLQSEPGLPHRKPRHKSQNSQGSDNQMSDISNDMRNLSQQGDVGSSMKSESNMSAACYGDIEITTADRSCNIEGSFSQKHENKQNNTAARFNKGDSTAEPPRIAMEHPSPVSVLDATFYGDESPSPVKKKSNSFKDDEGLMPDEADWSPIGVNRLSTSIETSLRFSTYYRKAENIKQLVQKVVNLDYTHEWSTINEIAPVCNSSNADDKYIVQVLLASGLLSELDSSFMAYRLHSSGHLINPNLFPAIEKTKASIKLLNGKDNGRKMRQLELIEKNHRQLIFDAVNEILVRKLVKESSYKQWFLPLEDRRPKRQQLVSDLCSEIDKIQTAPNISLDDDDDDSLKNVLWGELTLGSMDWTENRSEIPWVVLDVERLIFKDLICEVISGEAANLEGQPGGRSSQLFLK